MRIALYSYWYTWKQRPHHLVAAVNELGHKVTLFSTRSFSDYVRNRERSLAGETSALDFGTVHPIFPSPRFDGVPFLSRFNSWQRRRVLDDFCSSTADVHIFAGVPFEPLRSKPSILIYDCMDDWSDFPFLPMSVSEHEQQICRMADRIWVVSEHIYQKFEKDYGEKLEYVPNGVDYAHFAIVPDASVKRERPTLGYVGALHTWLDVRLIASVAARLHDWDIVLVGPVLLNPEQRQTLHYPNIQLMGRQPYDALPSIMSGFDVSMIPFILNDLIKGTSPIKLYEYLAAGLPVVSTSMPEVVAMEESGIVECADDPDSFVQSILSLYHTNSTALVSKRQEIARQHTWMERFRLALHRID